MSLRENHVGQDLLIPLRLSDFIPDDHICYFVMNVVEEGGFSDLNNKYLGNKSKSAYPREILANIVILGGLSGVFSSRKLARLCEQDLTFTYVSWNGNS